MAPTVRMMPLRRLRPAAAGAATSTPSAPVPGFVLERGRYTPVAIPPHLAATAPQGIVLMGINDRRQMAGEYEDPDGVGHGFLLDRGRFTTFDAPGATVTVPFGSTTAASSSVSTRMPPPSQLRSPRPPCRWAGCSDHRRPTG